MASKALFDVPTGDTAKVYIIDSTLRLSKFPFDELLKPRVDGFDEFNGLTTWSFLVESSTGKKVLFDLGVPKDIDTYPPTIVQTIKKSGWDLRVEKNVADILKENGTDPSEIQSVIWSHYHFDHIGDMSTFPTTTELVVGPGFKDAFYPGYPTKPDAPVREDYWKGRQLREIQFEDQPVPLKTGPFRAFDFFGDGSFYLLDTPGHAVGHLAGLVRTTQNPDTFVFMGGDVCHHGGEIRPSPFMPIPDKVQFPLPDALRSRMSSCPGGELFRKLNIQRGRKEDEPFFEPNIGADIPQAIRTIKKAQTADVQEDVFFIFAHDPSIRGVVDLYPLLANEWKSKGWSEKTQWAFLADLTAAAVNE
ncbi:beta-lactamase-like protein [Xylariales sp. AK1849]|nr:beta-lactamase-like protein [Xylariales sp. AK1849]